MMTYKGKTSLSRAARVGAVYHVSDDRKLAVISTRSGLSNQVTCSHFDVAGHRVESDYDVAELWLPSPSREMVAEMVRYFSLYAKVGIEDHVAEEILLCLLDSVVSCGGCNPMDAARCVGVEPIVAARIIAQFVEYYQLELGIK